MTPSDSTSRIVPGDHRQRYLAVADDVPRSCSSIPSSSRLRSVCRPTAQGFGTTLKNCISTVGGKKKGKLCSLTIGTPNCIQVFQKVGTRVTVARQSSLLPTTRMQQNTPSLPIAKDHPTPPRNRLLDRAAPFIRGGTSGVLSWLVIHPADVVKVRMQLAGEGLARSPYRGFVHAMRTISRTEGLSAMYSGLSAALTRQVTYTTLRLGLYSSFRDSWAQRHGGSVSTSAKFGFGMLAGGTASAVATPIEVSMVRMYNDGAATAATRRGYRNIFDALVRIGREEGVTGLWSGATPTIVRSMVVNCVQLATYDLAKEALIEKGKMRDGVGVHLAASSTSGLCYSIATLPIDSAKTRLQNQRKAPDGSYPYRSLAHAMVKVSSEEGVLSLWRGFMPYFSRCAGSEDIVSASKNIANLNGPKAVEEGVLTRHQR